MSEILTPSQLLEQPWVVYEAPPFQDKWEEYMRRLPKNLSYIHHLGSRSYWETFIWSPDHRWMNRQAANFAPYGEQLSEDDYAEALAVAKELAREQQVHHIRYDLEGAVEETWKNTAYKHIVGHSFHKIPPYTIATDYIEVDGKLWHMRDYYESQLAQTQ